jgi:hypothetical protein
MKPPQMAIGISLYLLATVAGPGQPVLTQSLSSNGELKWNDASSAFVQINSYAVEWAPRVGGTPPVWNPFMVIPATNTTYAVDVPMFYRLKANVEGRFPKLKMAVLSDLHYFEPSLLMQDGTAFQTYLAGDRKLLRESQAILDQMVTEVTQAQPDIVLVCGDFPPMLRITSTRV